MLQVPGESTADADVQAQLMKDWLFPGYMTAAASDNGRLFSKSLGDQILQHCYGQAEGMPITLQLSNVLQPASSTSEMLVHKPQTPAQQKYQQSAMTRAMAIGSDPDLFKVRRTISCYLSCRVKHAISHHRSCPCQRWRVQLMLADFARPLGTSGW